ncbi:Clavaminate synthase-like protein [Hibiscus syriacus]|uniref:Clavaminate synthase-like protein n=1 Tax=Hibiscus syriacus TaxID=106335 RepID=A0A6A2WE18_HIBSY|nr:Clavaminate synthase-like protein [Hibiscus syriacus]
MVYEKMEKYPEFVARLEEHGLIYTRVLGEDDDPSSPIGRGWKSTFLTSDKAVAEERAAKLGIKLEWTGDGHGGRLHRVGRREKQPGESSDFRGRPTVPADIIYDYLKILEDECAAFPWKKGDVLLIDNWAVLHARRPFDPPRRVLASLCKKYGKLGVFRFDGAGVGAVHEISASSVLCMGLDVRNHGFCKEKARVLQGESTEITGPGSCRAARLHVGSCTSACGGHATVGFLGVFFTFRSSERVRGRLISSKITKHSLR